MRKSELRRYRPEDRGHALAIFGEKKRCPRQKEITRLRKRVTAQRASHRHAASMKRRAKTTKHRAYRAQLRAA